MIITTATFDQIDEIVALWEECKLTRPWNDPEAEAAQAIDAPMSEILIALEGVDEDEELSKDVVGKPEIIGTALVGFDGHRGSLYYVATKPIRQGQRIATQLIDVAEKWLADRGASKVQLMFEPSDEQLQGFYEHLGYEVSEMTHMHKQVNQD